MAQPTAIHMVWTFMIEGHPRTILELAQRFSSEQGCGQDLFALRWPRGFACPRCAGARAWQMKRGLWLCQGCRAQVSVTAGTIFQDSHVPLTVWLRGMWHVASQKNGVRALGLQGVLVLGSYRTAWAMLHKLRRATGLTWARWGLARPGEALPGGELLCAADDVRVGVVEGQREDVAVFRRVQP